MNSNYLVSGNTVRPESKNGSRILDHIPLGLYKVSHCPNHGYYLQLEDYILKQPNVIYGDETNYRSKRILDTFNKNSMGNMGVMLSGLKGSGKTLLARQVALDCLKTYSMPVILVKDSFHGDDFKSFMEAITCPCLILIDEYDKLYSSEKDLEHEFLPILDGLSESKKLFVMTCNYDSNLSDYLIGRPSRVRYLFKYSGIERSVMKLIVDDNIKFPERSEEICSFLSFIPNLTFDKVMVFLNEFNMYGEDPKAIFDILNIGDNFGIEGYFGFEIFYGKIDITSEVTGGVDRRSYFGDDGAEIWIGKDEDVVENLVKKIGVDKSSNIPHCLNLSIEKLNLENSNIDTGQFEFDVSDDIKVKIQMKPSSKEMFDSLLKKV